MNNAEIIHELRTSPLFDNSTLGNRAADALEAALKQTASEPVAWQFKDPLDGRWWNFVDENHLKNTIEDGRLEIRALYTHPALQIPMTEDEIYKVRDIYVSIMPPVEFARLIEAHHKIGVKP